MKFLFKALDLLVASNIYVSFGVLILTWLSLDFRQISHPELLAFVFFSTVFIYNFIRLFRLQPMRVEGNSKRHEIILRNRDFLWFLCIISCLLACYFFTFIYESIWFYLFPFAVISLAYVLPVYKSQSGWFRLRDVPFIKIVLIALTWAFVTEGLPSILATTKMEFLPFFERFLFIFAITIPFDIRDLYFDHVSLKTIPQVLGVNKAKWLGISFLFIAELILFYRYFFLDEMNLWSSLAVYITYEISTFFVYKSHTNQKERFVTVGVEGMSILMGLMYLLFNY